MSCLKIECFLSGLSTWLIFQGENMSAYISNDRNDSFYENCAVASTLTGDGFRESKNNNTKTKPNQTHTHTKPIYYFLLSAKKQNKIFHYCQKPQLGFFLRILIKQEHERLYMMGWRDGSVVKNIACFSKGPEFNSQQLHCGSQPFVMRSGSLF